MNDYNKFNLNLKNKAQEFNVELDDCQIEQFQEFYKLLENYNSHTNLISCSDQALVYEKHFIDSLAIGLLKDKLNWDNSPRIIDIGIGGGFPGIPLIIANRASTLCAVDSVGKKTKFLELVAKELGFEKRVEVLNVRAEEIASNDNYRSSFDIAVTRAVAQLNVISEYCIPFLKTSGYFVPYKSKTAKQEINEARKALSILGARVVDFVEYKITNQEDVERNLILIEKIKPTPVKYPRATGIPKKTPLK